MKLRVLTVVALAAALAACESDSNVRENTTGGGMTSQATIVPGSQADLEANVGNRVFFDFDRYSLSSTAIATLNKQAAWMKRYGSVKVTIEGHADERGTREYNLALGERRANSIKNYLVSQGITADRLATVSFGKERPAAVGSGDAIWSQNRRGVTTVR